MVLGLEPGSGGKERPHQNPDANIRIPRLRSFFAYARRMKWIAEDPPADLESVDMDDAEETQSLTPVLFTTNWATR